MFIFMYVHKTSMFIYMYVHKTKTILLITDLVSPSSFDFMHIYDKSILILLEISSVIQTFCLLNTSPIRGFMT